MRKVLFYSNFLMVLLVSTWSTPVSAQSFEWVKTMGQDKSDEGKAIVTDASGNIYTTGMFSGVLTFGSITVTGKGSSDVFVAKQSPDGSFLWVKTFGGTDAQLWGYAITLDAANNVYTTGLLSGTADFDPGATSVNLSSGSVMGDAYISKLDQNGNFVWAKATQSPPAFAGSAMGFTITVDASQNVYVAGNMRGRVDFNPGTGVSELTANIGQWGFGGSPVFILKLTAAGDFDFVKKLDGPDAPYNFAVSIQLDAAENLYLAGTIQGKTDMNPSTAAADTFYLKGLGPCPYVLKLTNTGDFIWGKCVGYAADQFTMNAFTNGMVADKEGNTYVTGNFGGSIDFNPGTGAADTFYMATGGFYTDDDIFIYKLNSNGGFEWAKQMGGLTNDRGISIALDTLNNIYTTGFFISKADFNPSYAAADTFYLEAGSTDEYFGQSIFVSKLTPEGKFLWAVRLGSDGDFRDQGNGIVIDRSNNVYTIGSFKSIADFDPGPGNYPSTSAGDFDIFIHKMSQLCNDTTRLTETKCDSFRLNNQLFTTSGTYVQHFTNRASCDSAVILQLTVNNSTLTTRTETTCDTFKLNGQTYTSSETYTQTFATSKGCDSSIVINLTINKSTPVTVKTEAACGSYTLNNETYTANGTYFQNYTNAAGCDSIIKIVLTIKDVPSSSVTKTGNTLTADLATSYQWINCSSKEAIPDATAQSFTPSSNGTYAVVVTENDCSDTSDCIEITGFTGISQTTRSNNIQVYPNPANQIVNITSEYTLSDGNIKLLNLVGQIIEEKTKLNGNSFQLDISSYPAGVYVIELTTAGKTDRIKLTKK